ncbi:MAG: formylglycine-generating enzyme family protein [Bacteroidales bacterium]|jgi:formylglycine-generating enzyme required for sulfatase activity|nr:formylglycine-generating enzyme family protein [Bacteroidales bacterium]
MNKNIKNMAPDNFEALLLQTIINDFSKNKEIQKSIDMNAAYVFTMPIEPGIESISDQKIKEIIGKSKKSWFINIKVVFFLGIIGLITFFAYNLLNNNTSGNESGTPKTNIIPVTNNYEENKTDTLVVKEEIISGIHEQTHTYISKIENITPYINNFAIDTVGTERTEENKEAIPAVYTYKEPINNNFPVIKSFHPEYVEETNSKKSGRSPGKNVTADKYTITGYQCLVYPKDYSPKPPRNLDSAIIIHPNSNQITPIRTLPETVMIPLYDGIPFKTGFDNMRFISHTIDHLGNKVDTRDGILKLKLPEYFRIYNNEILAAGNSQKYFSENDNYKYLKPFYISKTEVSNLDYNEFIYWVVVRYNGGKPEHIKTPNENPDFFQYTFYKQNDEVEKHFGTNTINIYPNVECWRTESNHTEPMVEYYLHHPAYGIYPVVGVSYWQALAYVDWLTYIWEQNLKDNNLPYEIEFDLPYDYEWELASRDILLTIGYGEEGDYFTRSKDFSDNICNLAVKSHNDKKLRESMGLEVYSNLSFGDIPESTKSDTEFLHFYKFGRRPIYNKISDIKFMGGNVSEWTKMDYSPGWEQYITEERKRVKETNSPDNEYLLILEKYFDDNYNDKNGKLVHGANWTDKRNHSGAIDLKSALSAKVFINPDEQLPTVGFRFVMRIKLKDEEKIVNKINIIGRNLEGIDYSLIRQNAKSSKSKYTFNPPNGFSLIPNGKFHDDNEEVHIETFWAQQTETTNLTWMLFLNYLIDNNRTDDLKKCIPNDENWKIKINYEIDTAYSNQKIMDFSKLYQYMPFPKKFITDNKIDKMIFSHFAFEPVRGISHEAAQIFADWLSEMYNLNDKNKFRLPTETEWEYMAKMGNKCSPYRLYPWNGPYVRLPDCSLKARFYTTQFFEKKEIVNNNNCSYTKTGYYTYEEIKDSLPFTELVSKQNSETTDYLLPDTYWTKYSGPLVCASLIPNDSKLYDMSGNIAEMINVPTKTKGGSWASTRHFIEIKNSENWSGKPSDCVGFRLIFNP